MRSSRISIALDRLVTMLTGLPARPVTVPRPKVGSVRLGISRLGIGREGSPPREEV